MDFESKSILNIHHTPNVFIPSVSFHQPLKQDIAEPKSVGYFFIE